MEITELLTHDHREVESLFARFSASPPEQRKEIAADVIRELSRHDAVEVIHLYPAVRELGEHGQKLTEHSLGEHHEVRDLLVELDRNIDDAGTAAYEATWSKLVATIKDHVEEEEGDIFTLMRREIPPQKLEKLGAEARSTKETAPTRPHPSTPDNPSAASLMGKAASALDHVRDRAQHRS